MKYIEYLNIPSVPEHLLESCQSIIDKPTNTETSIPENYPFFKNKKVSNELTEWLQQFFDFKIFPQYQVIYKGLPIHIDKGNRVLAYNYLLDTGGNNVKTVIYNEKYQILQFETLELKKWHRIDTGMLHGVHGIDPNRIRVSLSVSSTVYR